MFMWSVGALDKHIPGSDQMRDVIGGLDEEILWVWMKEGVLEFESPVLESS